MMMSAIDLVNLILKYVFDGNSSSLWCLSNAVQFFLFEMVISYKQIVKHSFNPFLNWFLSEWVVVLCM